ncbi:hypothetical protein PR048_012281 [Dryococelus australis]|uniref:DUF4817 domain-containing protein n=1 Tax=Dryococelus australis TaxID=614101 RepID=A0ABQ9HPG5_9NEOP|nr:hypothetical protein PR048_012281 [Dryococelus australis]
MFGKPVSMALSYPLSRAEDCRAVRRKNKGAETVLQFRARRSSRKFRQDAEDADSHLNVPLSGHFCIAWPSLHVGTSRRSHQLRFIAEDNLHAKSRTRNRSYVLRVPFPRCALTLLNVVANVYRSHKRNSHSCRLIPCFNLLKLFTCPVLERHIAQPNSPRRTTRLSNHSGRPLGHDSLEHDNVTAQRTHKRQWPKTSQLISKLIQYSNSEKVEIMLIYGECSRIASQVEQLYRERYPDKTPPSRWMCSRLVVKLSVTGNLNLQQCTCRRTRIDQAAEVTVLADVAVNPHVSSRQLEAEIGISNTSAYRIHKRHTFRPYYVHLHHELHGNVSQNHDEPLRNRMLMGHQHNVSQHILPCKHVVYWTENILVGGLVVGDQFSGLLDLLTLTLWNFFLWDSLISAVYLDIITTPENMQECIIHVCKALRQATLEESVLSCIQRLNLCISASGHQFEHLIVLAMAVPEQSCGILHFHPAWLQKFATAKCFLIVFSLLSVLQGMAGIYTTATFSTLEKRFKFPSRIRLSNNKIIGSLLNVPYVHPPREHCTPVQNLALSGDGALVVRELLKTGNEISEILLCLTLTYYGGRGSRPRWLAWGIIISAVASFLLALPHAIYGAGHEALALTEEHLGINVFNASVPLKRDRLQTASLLALPRVLYRLGHEALALPAKLLDINVLNAAVPFKPARTVALHQGDTCSIPRGSLRPSHVGMMPDDATGRRALSGIHRFAPPLHSVAAQHLTSLHPCRLSRLDRAHNRRSTLLRKEETGKGSAKACTKEPPRRVYRGSPVPLPPKHPPPSFRRCSLPALKTLIGFQDINVKVPPKSVHSRTPFSAVTVVTNFLDFNFKICLPTRFGKTTAFPRNCHLLEASGEILGASQEQQQYHTTHISHILSGRLGQPTRGRPASWRVLRPPSVLSPVTSSCRSASDRNLLAPCVRAPMVPHIQHVSIAYEISWKSPFLCQANMTLAEKCGEVEAASGEYSVTPFANMFLSQFLLDVGTTLTRTLGVTYLDDHTDKKNTPFMMGIVYSRNDHVHAHAGASNHLRVHVVLPQPVRGPNFDADHHTQGPEMDWRLVARLTDLFARMLLDEASADWEL